VAIVVQIAVLWFVTWCSLVGRCFGGRFCLPCDDMLWPLKSHFHLLFSFFSCCCRQRCASSCPPMYLIDNLSATCQYTLTTTSVLKFEVTCSFKMLVSSSKTTWLHNQGDRYLCVMCIILVA
jgi:hypothetical protein